MSGFLTFFASAVSVMHLQGASALPGPVPADVITVIDGDTIAVRAHIWPGQYVETRVRLAGVDTPETRRAECEAERQFAHTATQFTRAWLEDHHNIQLRNIQLGSFAGRVIAELENQQGVSLNAELLSQNLAVEYGQDGNWCSINGNIEDSIVSFQK